MQNGLSGWEDHSQDDTLKGYQLTPQPLLQSLHLHLGKFTLPGIAHSPQDFSEDQKMLLSTVPEVLTNLRHVLILPTGNIPNSFLNVLSQVSCLPNVSSEKGVTSWLTIKSSFTFSHRIWSTLFF